MRLSDPSHLPILRHVLPIQCVLFFFILLVPLCMRHTCERFIFLHVEYPVKVSGSKEISVQDVLVGEVWLASGQSNMAFQVKSSIGGPEAVAASQDPELRFSRWKPPPPPNPPTHRRRLAGRLSGHHRRLFRRGLFLRPHIAAAAESAGRHPLQLVGRHRRHIMDQQGSVRPGTLLQGLLCPLANRGGPLSRTRRPIRKRPANLDGRKGRRIGQQTALQ